MGSPYTIFKVIIIFLLLTLTGCLQSQNSIVLQDICCQKINNSKCEELRNASNLQQNLNNIIINDGGKCSDLSRNCYDMNLTYQGITGKVVVPYCRYANINNCETGFTALVYDSVKPKQKVNYDALIQQFMFNTSYSVEQGEEIKYKTPFNLLYGTLSRKFIGIYDFDKFNIYGTKFGVGDSILEYEHYKYFYPFDYDYQGIEGFNPIFYNIDEDNPRKCTLYENKYKCGNETYETWESCLLICEMPNTAPESLYSFYNPKYKQNKSYGYEYIYSNFADTKKVLSDSNFYELLTIVAGLDRLMERYPVGLFKTFSQPTHPNFFHKIYFNQTSLTKTQGLILTGCLFIFGLGFGSKDTYSINEGNYTAYIKNGNISISQIDSIEDRKVYRKLYNFTLILNQLNLTKHSQSCLFIFCSCTSSPISTDIEYNLSLSEIFIEEEYPMNIMHDIAKKYYRRFNFSTENTERPFIQRFDRTTNTFYNFSGLPFECIYEDKSGTSGTCSVEYYARYTCINASNNQSLDCWCDPTSCYAYYPSPEYGSYAGPMLGFIKTGYEALPTLTYNLTFDFSSPVFISRRTIKLNGKNAVVIPVSSDLDYNNYRLKKACFSRIQDEIMLCDAANPGGECPRKDTEEWNTTFKRYDFQFEDIVYLSKVVIIIDKNNDGNYGDCKGKKIEKIVNGTKQEFLDLDLRIFGLPIPSNPTLTSILVKPKFIESFEYSGKETDNMKVARFACVNPEMNYGEEKFYQYGILVGSKDKYELGSYAFDDFGRLIGCYGGAIAINRSLDAELLFKSRREYIYGLYKHYPNTRDIANYLITGKQLVFILDDNFNMDYLKKILREVDVFLLTNERIPRPFIKYSSTPLGAIIVVCKNNCDYNKIKNICPTCLVSQYRNMIIDGNSITYLVPSYGTSTIDISNNLPMSCPGVKNVSVQKNDDVLFYNIQVSSINSNTIYKLIEALENINTQSGGMPIYLYINASNIQAKKLIDQIINHSHNLSSKGVMGIHIGEMKNYLMLPDNSYSSSIELSRSIMYSIARTPILFKIDSNTSNCTYIIDKNNAQSITCLPDPLPRITNDDVFPHYNLVVDYNNFARHALEIALSNYYNENQICIKSPNNELFTYKILKDYIKGTNPVIYDEIGNRTFDFVEYKYNNYTNMICLPRKCEYKLETFCKPATCYRKGQFINSPGSSTRQISTQEIHEYGFGVDVCNYTTRNINLRGYGIFEGRNEIYYRVQDGCDPPENYSKFELGNTSFINIVENNCSINSGGYYTNLNLISNNTNPYPISYQQRVYEVKCQSWGNLIDSACLCAPYEIILNKTSNSQSESFNIRDDRCGWGGGNTFALKFNRTIILPPIFNINFTETYNANWCEQRYILRCE